MAVKRAPLRHNNVVAYRAHLKPVVSDTPNLIVDLRSDLVELQGENLLGRERQLVAEFFGLGFLTRQLCAQQIERLLVANKILAQVGLPFDCRAALRTNRSGIAACLEALNPIPIRDR
jgi:hypothetical protein